MIDPRAIVAASLVLALVAPACSGDASDASRSNDPTPTSTASKNPPATATPGGPAVPPIAAPKGWKTFAYQRIAFAYPPLPGTVTTSASSAPGSGPRYAWSIRRSDRCDPRGTCRSYEFAAVNDGCPGTPGWPTYAHAWVEAGGKHSVTTCDGKASFGIDPIRIVTRSDGLRGIIYDADEWFPKGEDVAGSLAAVLNFPRGYDQRFEAIAFYFEDPTPLSTIETVLRLVRLS